jgi:hypothetical protein
MCQLFVRLHRWVLSRTLLYSLKPMLICFPGNPSREQLAAIFVQWADKNVNKWHEPPWNTVFAAFADAFPCKNPLQ